MNYPITPGVPAVTIRPVATSSRYNATTIQITTHPTTSPHCTLGKQGHINSTGGLAPKLRIVVKTKFVGKLRNAFLSLRAQKGFTYKNKLPVPVIFNIILPN